MSTLLSWLWMKAEFSPLWRRITLRRHRSELWALQTARSMPTLAIFPIFLTVGGWYFLLGGMPSLVLFLLQQFFYTLSPLLGLGMLAANSILSIVALCLIAPWFFRWYFIAAGMMVGHMQLADRKEVELTAAIAAAERPG